MLHGGEGVWNGDNQESQPGVRKAQWEAQIRRKGYPDQRKTFETKSDAQAWARMIESEIDRGIFASRVEAKRTAFHQLIDRYINCCTLRKPMSAVMRATPAWTSVRSIRIAR
ncbi:hypothetical protein PSA5_02080 [Pseudomonas syringae pv. actinidiae]|nr:hypothetical protein PSA5_02080 [Pseudomonas syringae pv. actinidiae]